MVQTQKDHPIIKKENFIKNYVKTYFKEFGPETVQKLTPSGSSPGKMYGLVKVHKDNNPIRPLVSMIGIPEYQLANFLDIIIKPYIPQTYMLKSKKQFFGSDQHCSKMEKLNNLKVINEQIIRLKET